MNLRQFLTPEARRSSSTPDMVATVLREAILASAVAPGNPIRQDDVAAQLQVSKIPVREGLRRLEAEGLVVFEPNRGVVVAALSRTEAQEIVEMRLALETLALRHAIPGLGARELRRAAALVDDLDHEDEAARLSALNWEFHASLYDSAGKPLLLDTLRGLHVRVDRYMRLMLSTLQHHETSQREHRALLDACTARDVEAAAAVLAVHIRGAGARLDNYLAARSEPDAPAGAAPRRQPDPGESR